jgi:hypothetical protein
MVVICLHATGSHIDVFRTAIPPSMRAIDVSDNTNSFIASMAPLFLSTARFIRFIESAFNVQRSNALLLTSISHAAFDTSTIFSIELDHGYLCD